MKIKEYHLKANYPSAFIHILGALIEHLPLQEECTDVLLIIIDDKTAKKQYHPVFKNLNEDIGSFEFLSDKEVQTEKSAQFTRIKWQILKEDETTGYHLHLVDIDKNNTLLQINYKDIYRGFKKGYRHYMIDGKAYKNKEKFIEALKSLSYES